MTRTQIDEVCLRALESKDCSVEFNNDNTVTVRFPPDPDDPHAAPDGEERRYSRAFFTLMITRVFMELVEQGTIDGQGRALKSE